MNNVPTIFLKTLTPKPVMNRTSRNRLGSVPKTNEGESIIAAPTTYQTLEEGVDKKELEMINLKKQIQGQTDIHAKEKHELREKSELLMNQLSAWEFALDKFRQKDRQTDRQICIFLKRNRLQ